MKKILLFLAIAASIGLSQNANAQCAGANVTITNIVVSNQGAGTYNISYTWHYNNGNASISVVLKCGGVVVATAPCNGDLHGQSGGVAGYSANVSLQLTLPDPNCIGLKEVEFRIYASSNCNGTFCPIGQNITLPVKFASFNAARNHSNVNITWTTASEFNNRGFAVERNSNGSWEQIGWVASQATNGSSDAALNYSFTDVNGSKGISQYRIRQVDADNKTTYSDIRAVRGEGQVGKITIYPNPTADGKVNVVFDDASVVRNVSVLDMSGRSVKEFRSVSNNNITIVNLQPGMYTVKIAVPETGEQVVQKIVVNKR